MGLNVITKFELKEIDRQTIALPTQFSMLSIGYYDGQVCIWAATDRNAILRDVEIVRVGPDVNIPHVGDFIGSVHDLGQVWHYFTGPGDSANRLTGFHYQTAGN